VIHHINDRSRRKNEEAEKDEISLHFSEARRGKQHHGRGGEMRTDNPLCLLKKTGGSPPSSISGFPFFPAHEEKTVLKDSLSSLSVPGGIPPFGETGVFSCFLLVLRETQKKKKKNSESAESVSLSCVGGRRSLFLSKRKTNP